MRGPALLLDVHSLVHRAHHALPPMNTAAGEPTAALYGFSTVLVKLLRERAPCGLGLAFDAGARRRRAIDPGYKSSRRPPPPELAAQLARVRELPERIGAPTLMVAGEEADDVLATAARALVTEGHEEVLVVSGDRDLLQIAGPAVRILFVGRRGGAHEEYDAAAVEKRFGVPPRALPDLRAFLGDPADDLPGLAGVGPRIAARWVTSHRDMAGILAQVESLEPAHLRERVRAAGDRLRQVADLGRLIDDLPLPGPHLVAWNDDTRAALKSWFEALEFRSLVPRLA